VDCQKQYTWQFQDFRILRNYLGLSCSHQCYIPSSSHINYPLCYHYRIIKKEILCTIAGFLKNESWYWIYIYIYIYIYTYIHVCVCIYMAIFTYLMCCHKCINLSLTICKSLYHNNAVIGGEPCLGCKDLRLKVKLPKTQA